MTVGRQGEVGDDRSAGVPSRRRDAAWWDALIATLQDAFYVVDDEHRFVEVNEAFRTILGHGPEGLPYHPPYPWWPDPEHDPEGHRVVAETLARPAGRAVLPMVHRDGRRVWAEVAFSTLTDPATGRPHRVGTFRDVTADHLSAERLRDRAEAAHAARTAAERLSGQLQRLLQGLSAIVWEADARTWAVSFVSGRAEELLGYPVRNWLDDPEFWPSIIHPDDRAATLAECERATATGADFELVYRAITADGRTVWLRDLVHVLTGAGGEPDRLQGVMIDITEQRRAEEASALLAEVGRVQAGPGSLADRLTGLARACVPAIADMAVVSIQGADGLFRPIAVVHPTRPEMERTVLGFPPHPLPAQYLPNYRAGRPFVVHSPPESLLRAAAVEEQDRRALGMRTVLNVPLSIGSRLLGTLAFVSTTRARDHDAAELELAAELGRRAAIMVETERLATRESTLARITAALAAAGSVAEAAQAVVDGLVEALDATAAAAMILIPGQGLQVVRTRSYPAAIVENYGHARLSDDQPVAECARTGEPVWLRDHAQWAARYPRLMGHHEITGNEAFAALPLTVAGRVVGAVSASFGSSRQFDDDERSFAMGVVAQAAQAFERAALADARREIAETLQHSLLPAALPRLERLALAARYLSGARGAQAGGDWYEVLPLDGDQVGVVVGDVVGQGAPAAAVMGQLRSVLAAALLAGNGPAQALEHLELFARRVPGARASSVACLVLDTGTGALCWAAAGHPPPLVLDPAGGSRFLDSATGAVLAAPRSPGFTQDRTVLEPGSTLVLYTDGLVERRGEVVDDGLDRLAAAVGSGGGAPPDALLRHVLDRTLHPGGPPDDVALIIARLLPAPLRLRLPARPDQLPVLRRAVHAWAAAAGLDADLEQDLQLAVGEAAANSVEHAYAGAAAAAEHAFTVELDHEAGGAVAGAVLDQGTWRPVPADNGHRGHGLRVVRGLAAEVVVEHGPQGTSVRFWMAFDPIARGSAPAWSAQVPPAGPVDPDPAAVERTELAAGLRLTLRGDLDLQGVAAVRAALLGEVERDRRGPLEIDLTSTGYLASAGVGLLVEVIEKAQRHGRAVDLLAPPTGHVRAVLGLVGLTARSPDEPPSAGG
jgi:anti-anti-sigma factor